MHRLIEPRPPPIPKIFKSQKIQCRHRREQNQTENKKLSKFHGKVVLILTYFAPKRKNPFDKFDKLTVNKLRTRAKTRLKAGFCAVIR